MRRSLRKVPTEGVPLPVRWIYPVLRPLALALLKVVPNDTRRKWFGSDIFERYTTEYTWHANQLGHFALGLIALFASLWLGRVISSAHPFVVGIVIGLALLLLYMVKEVSDYIIADEMNGVFQIDRAEVVKDGLADVFFVSLGFAFAIVAHDNWVLEFGLVTEDAARWSGIAEDVAFFALGLLIALPFRNHYIPRKVCYDRSDLPFYYRLQTYDGQLEAVGGAGQGTAVVLIEAFAADTADKPRHLLIHGERGTGKTSIAVGIGVALTLRLKKTRFVSGVALRSELDAELAPDAPEQPYRWPIRDVGHLIVDDVVAGDSPEQFLARLPVAVVDKLAGCKSVWALAEGEAPAPWRSAIVHRLAKGDASAVAEIRLTKVLADKSRRKIVRVEAKLAA